MAITYLLTLGFALLLQAGELSTTSGEIFLPDEKARIEREANVERRIKIYERASKRLQQELETLVIKENFDSVPGSLRLWSALLTKSLEDIETNLKTKKKSGALKNYEIQLRKSIARTESLKMRAPVDQQDIFDSCLEQAEKTRKKFVDILFRH